LRRKARPTFLWNEPDVSINFAQQWPKLVEKLLQFRSRFRHNEIQPPGGFEIDREFVSWTPDQLRRINLALGAFRGSEREPILAQ
jgi:hypothetical protein